MSYSYHFGYKICPIEIIKETKNHTKFIGWKFIDTNESIKGHNRPCPKCGKHETDKGHDPCISNLPHVKNACCGHGVTDGYIMFEDDRRIIKGEINELLKLGGFV